MKFIIHLIDDNRLILAPENDSLSPAQVERIAETLNRWNDGDVRNLVLPIECEIIDLRTPQKEQIEATVKLEISKLTNEIVSAIASGFKKE